MARVAGEDAPRAAVYVGAAAWSVVQSGSLVVVLIGWELLARSGMFTAFLLPPLSAVLARVAEDAWSGLLPLDAAVTLYRALLGFLIAGVAGIALGILIARVPAIHWFFDPIVSVGFPMPKVAFLPVFMLWFGLYDFSKISMIVFNAIFPVIAATVAGTQGVDKHVLWSARSLGARERDVLWEIVLPAALPQILTGLQVALPTALIVGIVTEILMGGDGIGATMIRSSRFADSPGVFAGIVEIAALGWLVIKGMEKLRRRLLVWHQEAQVAATM
jgi:ABC-type nitrate/sulfonate/bicarbonate transport system permease component